jgi:hypothetical protein
MFPVYDNPAERLLFILNEALRMPDHLTNIHVWSKIFNFDEKDKKSFFHFLAHLNILLDEIEIRLSQDLTLNQKLFLGRISPIRDVFCPDSINTSWGQLNHSLKKGAIVGLEFCADALGKLCTEINIEDSEIQNIKNLISDVYKEVNKSEFSPEFKIIILDLLSSIQISLDHYKIYGNEGIKRSIIHITGLFCMHFEHFKKEEKNPTIQKVKEILARLFEALKIACAIKEIGQTIKNLLS